ncbi:hypothetical protein M413DRAFT_23010 [Hebeloma cylindrosporum]|uniref:Uncharacterized protein n=1 Tax=Hebeloma cylindrosporum TaxID=76867 RepID=A0A0C3CCY7_HEBCY|nr:hypothetical protein M413DRAFT_23010 [Hebeloma cylindrosporum h7]
MDRHHINVSFDLWHEAGKTFEPDGLSRRDGQPGDEVFENPEADMEEVHPPEFEKKNPEDPDPLLFEDFKTTIDTRGGYVQEIWVQELLDDYETTEEKEDAAFFYRIPPGFG